MARYWLHQLNLNKASDYSEEGLERVSGEMWSVLEKQTVGIPSVPRVRRLWPRWAVAASIALAVMVGGYFYNDSRQPTTQVVHQNDVAPGKNGATLTLASGKKIRLSDAMNGELTSEAGVSISKTKDGQLIYEIKADGPGEESNKINTLSTANGETYQVRLPDGSAVWLNAASSLTYSANLLQDGKRSVKLVGEAYFEVAKDKAHPFVVNTAGQEIEVLGTHFNVNAYGDEPVTATTLLEGSVQVRSGSFREMIRPGFQASSAGKGITVGKADVEGVTDWKSGEFNLEQVDFRSAMRKIARWYDVEVIYEKSVPVDIEGWGWISRASKLSVVLKLIENSGQVKFRIEGKKVYVFK